MARSLAALALALVACSAAPPDAPESESHRPSKGTVPTETPSDAMNEDDTSGGGGGGPRAPQATAFKPAFPTVEHSGGPVIKNPRVVPIVFGNDPFTSDIGTFTKRLGASSYWSTTAGEYGIGPFTATAPVVARVTVPAQLTDTQIQQWLVSNLTGTSPMLGRPDPSTLYALFLPADVAVDAADMTSMCNEFLGYHSETVAGGVAIGYAVMPRCGDLDQVTTTTSHEIFEWATDPFFFTRPAWQMVPDAHWAWGAAGGGAELGDMCTLLDPELPRPAELGYQVQRFWSNKLSLAGKFPCAPVRQAPYVQAVPDATDDVIVPRLPDLQGTVKTKAIRVPRGGSRTIDVHVYADDMTAAGVKVDAFPIETFFGVATTAGFSFQVPPSVAAPGSTVPLTITAPPTAGATVVLLTAGDFSKGAAVWPVVVTNDEVANVAAGIPAITPTRLASMFAAFEAGGSRWRRPLQQRFRRKN